MNLSKLKFKLAQWLLRGMSIEYWAKTQGNSKIKFLPEVYINGKRIITNKWTNIALDYN